MRREEIKRINKERKKERKKDSKSTSKLQLRHQMYHRKDIYEINPITPKKSNYWWLEWVTLSFRRKVSHLSRVTYFGHRWWHFLMSLGSSRRNLFYDIVGVIIRAFVCLWGLFFYFFFVFFFVLSPHCNCSFAFRHIV